MSFIKHSSKKEVDAALVAIVVFGGIVVYKIWFAPVKISVFRHQMFAQYGVSICKKKNIKGFKSTLARKKYSGWTTSE